MEKLTERDLNYVIDNGIIDAAYIQEYIQRMKREEILKQHSRKYHKERMESGEHT